MVTVIVLMITGGVGLAQAVSNPWHVTLSWLRLGGIIALSLLAVATAISFMSQDHAQLPSIALAAALFFTQLIAVQKAWRHTQRLAAALAYLTCTFVVWRALTTSSYQPSSSSASLADLALSVALSSGLMGGFLMTMLLGHAYLTAGGQMTQAPLRRLVLTLASLLLLRILLSALALWLPPHSGSHTFPADRLWSSVMLTARWALGLIMPTVFIYMIYDCVRRRANQSATGILYVATVLVMIGEGIALALLGSSPYAP